jgi:dUTPase
MNRIRFCKVREVEVPSYANQWDAGLDFKIPSNLTIEDIRKANDKAEDIVISPTISGTGMVKTVINQSTGFITSLVLGPHSRVLIPSGIRVLIEPEDSMLMAANKSGKSYKKGLVYTAEIVDSPYTGEIHLGICNTSSTTQTIEVGSILQFIHVPIYITPLEEISVEEYETLATTWGTRGSNGLGSGD